MRWSKNGEEPETSFPLQSGEGNIVIAPGSVAIAASRTVIDNLTLIEACGGDTAAGTALEREVFLYVWGSIRYDNGFRRVCTTRFCHRYNWATRNSDELITPKLARYSIAAEFARYHQHGNDAD